MPTRLVVLLGVVFVGLGAAAVAQEEIPIQSWPAPPYWAPPAQPQAATEDAEAVVAEIGALGTEALPTEPLPFIAVTPCRLIDTRNPAGTYGGPPLAAGVPRSFPVAAQCGVAATAGAISINATVTNTQGPGFVAFYPEGGTFPGVSNVNYTAAWQTVANAAVVPLGPGGFTALAGVSGTDLIVDVNGYYAPEGVRSVFGRTGAVTATAGDYTATQVTNVPAGGIAATTVQAAVNELDGEKADLVHSHSGADITSGTVVDARIDATVARDSEILPTVLANDGAGSTLDADLLDGSHASAFLTSGGGVAWTLLTGVPAGFADGIDNDTTYTAGPGLTLTVTDLAVGAGSGIAVGADSVGLGPLTANWSQTGAFDVVLANAASELQIMESAGGTYFGTLDVGDLAANQTFTLTTGGTVWTSGNDGTGSTLDADLLDGSHASSFAGSAHTHAGADITSGTVAEPRIDATVARDTEILPTVLAGDGSGSTLDADLLDGSHATAFAGSAHTHWGQTWTGSGTGLTLSAVTTGLSASGNDSFGVYGIATGTSYQNAGTYGRSNSSIGYGLAGYNYLAGVGVGAWSYAGDLIRAYSGDWPGGELQFYVTSGGSVYANDTYYTFRPAAGADGTVQVRTLYTPQSPEPWADDYGTAELVAGTATVTIEPMFASTVDLTVDYRVFLTPLGDCPLYVAAKGATSFTVRAIGGQPCSIGFDYRLVARPKGTAGTRLAVVDKDLGSPSPRK